MKIFKHLYWKFSDRRRLRKTIIKAEKLHRTYNDRFYIIADDECHLYAINKYMFKTLRKDGFIQGSMFMRDLQERSLYYTARSNGTGRMSSEERKAACIAFIQKARNYRDNLGKKHV